MVYLKQINRLLLIGGMSTVPGLTRAQQANDEKPKNILMILVDDLKPNLGCYGDEVAVSPNIDRLAAQGVTFNTAYCNQAVSVASRYNLLTGARSTTSGLYNFGRQMRDVYPDAVTLPQFFMKAGYHAEAIGKVFHVGHGNTNDDASWSIPHHYDKLIEYLLPESTGRQLTREEGLFENTHLYFPDIEIGKLPRGSAWEAPDVMDDAYADGRVARKAIDRLRELKKEPEQPFFMAVGFVRPHLPFSVPKKYWDMYDPGSLPMPQYEKDAENAPKVATKRGGEIDQFEQIPAGQYVYADSLTRKLIHGYYASLSYMDVQVGRLLDELERLDMLDNTIIVLWGDHGWHLGDHGYWTKHTNYEQANRIPLIMVAPGVGTPGTYTGQPVETVDIYPTLTELAGLREPVTPQPIDGLSMVPVLKDPQKRIRDHAYHAFPHGKYIGRAIRTERYRMVEWKNREDTKDVLYELYDYQNDPLETKNIADKETKVLKSMQKILATHPEPKMW